MKRKGNKKIMAPAVLAVIIVLSVFMVTVSAMAKETVDTNVALNAKVTLHGGPFFTDGWGDGRIVSKDTIVDGVFLPRGTQWDQGAVWWDSHDDAGRHITIDLGNICSISDLVVQADDNDGYLLYYWDLVTNEWLLAWDVPKYDEYGWGMKTRPNPSDDTERYVLPSPIVTNALKFEGNMSEGDKNFSVSEIHAYGTQTPTPTPTPTVTPSPGELGSSFDNPITIYKEGTVRGKLSEGEIKYYKIWLNKDKDVTITLDFGYLADIISNSNLDIYLCNPDREQVGASTGENWNAFEVDEQIEYNTRSEEGYYYIKIVNLHSQPHYEPEEFSLGVKVKSLLLPKVIEPTPVLLGTYALELSAPGSNIIDGKIGEIKVFGSSNKHRIEIELDTPVVRLYNAENRYLGDYDMPLTFHGSDSVILLSFDEKVHMNLDGFAFYDSDGNQIEQGGGLLDALLMDIISIGLGKIIPVPIPTSTLGVLLESQDEMLVPDILSDDRTHDIKSVVIAPKRGEVKKVVVFFSKGLDGTPVDNTLHLYVHVKGTGYPSGLSLGQYIPPIIVGTKYINDIPLVS